MKLKIVATLVIVSLIGIGGGIYLGSEYRNKNIESTQYNAKIALHEKFVKEANAKYLNFAWAEANPEFNSDKLDEYNKKFVFALETVSKMDKEITSSYPILEAESGKEIFTTSKKVSESMAKRSMFLDCAIGKKALEIDYLEVVKLKNLFLESDKIETKITQEEDDAGQAKYVIYLKQIAESLENVTNCATSYGVGTDITEITEITKKYKKYAELATRYFDIVDEESTTQADADKTMKELNNLSNNYKIDEGKYIRDYIVKIVTNIDQAVIRK